MRRKIIRAVAVGLLVAGLFADAQSQQQQSETLKELWTDADAYVPLNEKWRLFFRYSLRKAEETREDLESTVGVHVDYTINKRFSFRGGYRYGFSSNDANPFREHRIVAEQTIKQELPLAILLSDRNREDFRFVDGKFSFRYRNRIQFEREFRMLGRSFTPHGSVEVFHDSRFDLWNRNRLTAGTQIQMKRGFPLLRELSPRRQVILDLYYTKQTDSRSDPHHVHAIGATIAFHF
jgi:uncharacterized protein DUF2490